MTCSFLGLFEYLVESQKVKGFFFPSFFFTLSDKQKYTIYYIYIYITTYALCVNTEALFPVGV